MTEIKLTTGSGFRTEIQLGSHTIVADEPASAGGTDDGPNPYDLLAASLGACTAMTLRFYANRESYPLDGLDVTVSQERIHARDCSECETETGFVHRFDVKIRLEGKDLTEQQRAKLLEVSGRCPVAKTLKREVMIVDELVTQ